METTGSFRLTLSLHLLKSIIRCFIAYLQSPLVRATIIRYLSTTKYSTCKNRLVFGRCLLSIDLEIEKPL